MRFKKYIESVVPDLRGEYWITPYGIYYADGDIGDMNHEAYAIEAIRNDILSRFNKEEDDWDDFIANNDYNKIFNQLKKWKLPPKTLESASGFSDAREYVVVHYGWKRVAGSNIESFTLSAQDMKQISSGLNDILEQEGYFDEYEESEVEQMEFYISTYKGQRYTFTLEELQLGRKLPQKPTPYDSEAATKVAKNQIDQIEKSKMHPTYKHFGDWNQHF